MLPSEHNPKEVDEQALAMFLSARLDATPGRLSVCLFTLYAAVLPHVSLL